jgi:hypothetical protein
MSCLGPNYNPIPPREWNRFESECTYNNFGITPSASLQLAFNKKGNILQYKKNSANLTKKQIYSQIARGMYTNRTTTWATQTESYTNPNTRNLLRANAVPVSIPLNQIPYLYPTCANLVNTTTNTLTILDGGTLNCNIIQNPCTGQQTYIGRRNICYPTSDSNVPGPGFLCYDDSQQTYYPKVRRTYLAGSSKWPVNSKFIFPA